jgi:hypothetical protein
VRVSFTGHVPWRDASAFSILVVAGLLATGWAVVNVWGASTRVPASAGGIGAVSSGLVLELLRLLPLLLVNWSLARVARRHGRLAERFRRAHLWFTASYLAWAVAAEMWFMRANAAVGTADAFFRVVKVRDVVDAPFLPLQFFFASSVLAFAIGNPGKRQDTR